MRNARSLLSAAGQRRPRPESLCSFWSTSRPSARAASSYHSPANTTHARSRRRPLGGQFARINAPSLFVSAYRTSIGLCDIVTNQNAAFGRCRRGLATTPSSSSPTSASTNNLGTMDDGRQPMDKIRLYRYLKLQTFTKEELGQVFDQMAIGENAAQSTSDPDDIHNNSNMEQQQQLSLPRIADFLQNRIDELEQERLQQQQQQQQTLNDDDDDDHDPVTRQLYAQQEAKSLYRVFHPSTNIPSTIHWHTNEDGALLSDDTDNQDEINNNASNFVIARNDFVETLHSQASTVDVQRIWPITLSILLVGTSVGIVTPAMPFVVSNLGLTPGEYGTVVSAFALAKMAGNVPSAILVERHGRKPYLTFSLALIAIGVGGMGAATSFEQLYFCRLITGAGVAALTTASQLMVTDVSTPLNRATTMSPIVSAFAAGTALGPAIGGTLVDNLGLEATFYLVGTSYLGVALLNRTLLEETKRANMRFPWHDARTNKRNANKDENTESFGAAAKHALGQWVPLMKNPRIRSIMVINAFYWFALSGSQMTLLPLILTDPEGLNMTASGVGQVYMGMSIVHVLSNPIMAKYLVDRIGTAPAIAGGCAVIASAMTVLPLATGHWTQLAGSLGLWALGSSMLSTAPLAYISDECREEERAQSIAMLRTSGDVGFLFGSSMVGAFAGWAQDLDVAMQSSGSLLFAATFWFATRQKLLAFGYGSTVDEDKRKDK